MGKELALYNERERSYHFILREKSIRETSFLFLDYLQKNLIIYRKLFEHFQQIQKSLTSTVFHKDQKFKNTRAHFCDRRINVGDDIFMR